MRKFVFSLMFLILLKLIASQRQENPFSEPERPSYITPEILRQIDGLIKETAQVRADIIELLEEELSQLEHDFPFPSRHGRHGRHGRHPRNSAGVIRDRIRFCQTFQYPWGWYPCFGIPFNNGTTWSTRDQFCRKFGIGRVCCNGNACYPNSKCGNTDCRASRPLLCIDQQNINRPDYIENDPENNG